jgi:Mlc titration factor MtfA (ptsG expression regulator)
MNTSKKRKVTKVNLPANWKEILYKKVGFYRDLEPEEKTRFEADIMSFLANYRITGVRCEIDITDKLLVASSGVIPIFAFPDWEYQYLDEVLIYPSNFDENFNIEGNNRNISGMVGSGPMEGKMILSKTALHQGFSIESDKKNVGVHEFIHLIDKSDGQIDGIPKLLMDKQYALPWFDLIHTKSMEIRNNKSDINPYGATDKVEFFSVIGEYFFERPKLLKQKHPKLYAILEDTFKQNMADIKKGKRSKEIHRNDPCPCGSGLKYKKCCGAN